MFSLGTLNLEVRLRHIESCCSSFSTLEYFQQIEVVQLLMSRFFINWDVELRETKKYIDGNPSAKKALNVLVKKGCQEELILQNLFLYSGGNPNQIRIIRREFKWRKDQMKALFIQLLKNADEIESLTLFLADMGIHVHPTPADDLRKYARLVRRLSDKVVHEWAYLRKSGRDQHLEFLHKVIVRCTGRSHYKEIAAMADAVALGYGYATRNRSAEDLAKLIRRSIQPARRIR